MPKGESPVCRKETTPHAKCHVQQGGGEKSTCQNGKKKRENVFLLNSENEKDGTDSNRVGPINERVGKKETGKSPGWGGRIEETVFCAESKGPP